jgi:predicted double-glycine peptidase
MAVTRNPSSETQLPNVASMPFLFQGTSNGCGTTSLAMVMSYLGVPETKAQVDAVIRQLDIFSSPEDMMGFATSHGLQAQGYNHGAWENIESFIPLGQPCICLINANYTYPDNSTINGFHYVAITGFGVDSTNNQRYAIFHDPNFTKSEMVLYESQFVQMGDNMGWGFRDYFMAFTNFASPVPLPPGNRDGIQGVLGTLEGVTNITNGIGNIFHPSSVGSVFHGIFQFVGGVVETIGSGIGGLLQVGGQWLSGIVADIPVLRNIVQPIGDIINGVGAIVGDIFNGVGSIVNDIGVGIGGVVDAFVNGVISIGRNLGGAFAALGRGNIAGFVGGIGAAIGSAATAVAGVVTSVVTAVANVVSDAATTVVNVVSDAANTVVNAVSDFFSGW